MSGAAFRRIWTGCTCEHDGWGAVIPCKEHAAFLAAWGVPLYGKEEVKE